MRVRVSEVNKEHGKEARGTSCRGVHRVGCAPADSNILLPFRGTHDVVANDVSMHEVSRKCDLEFIHLRSRFARELPHCLHECRRCEADSQSVDLNTRLLLLLLLL